MPRWNQYTERMLSKLTTSLKRKRFEFFVRALQLGPKDIILDLGSEDGSYLARFYPYPRNIVLADVSEEPLLRGVARFGLKGYLLLPAHGGLPLGDLTYDAIWCNSVIEHVTLDREELPSVDDGEFRRRADQHQRLFAAEIARVARKYFVQTPYLHFPIEAHAWLPFVQYLRHEHQWFLSRRLRNIWIKQWRSSTLLYDLERFRRHFPDATRVYIERLFGLPKSLIAIRT